MAKISKFGMHAASLLGFERIADVRGTRSVQPLFENAMVLSGIYLQVRPNRHLYVGQTNNIIKRFDRHLQNGVVIEELAFRPASEKTLLKKEKEVIDRARRLGLEVDNLMLVEAARAKANQKLEDFLTPKEEKEWLTASARTDDKSAFKTIFDAMTPGQRQQFEYARAQPIFGQIIPLARRFVKTTIPKPANLAGVFWCATSYTQQLTESFLPIIRVHAGQYTLLTLGAFKDVPNEPWCIIAISRKALNDHGFSLENLANDIPYVILDSTDATNIKLSTHARFLPNLLEDLLYPLRQTILAALKTPATIDGNPALESLISK